MRIQIWCRPARRARATMAAALPPSLRRYFQIQTPFPVMASSEADRVAAASGWGSDASGMSCAGCHGELEPAGGRWGGGGQPFNATGPIGAGMVVVGMGGAAAPAGTPVAGAGVADDAGKS